MRSYLSLTLLLAAASPVSYAITVQKPGLHLPRSARANRDAVERIFSQSYDAYKKYAWGHDDLTPETKTYFDGRNGWGATVVDAMTTLHIMGQKKLFAEAVDFSSNIDFSKSQTDDTVSVFETTIRYLGGLLSAYELSDRRFPALLQKAKEVGDKMAYAWVGNNSVPFGFLDFATNEPIISTSNIAEAGTLILEWSTLSKYTRNDTYRRLAEGSFRQIGSLPSPFPGMAVQGINPADGQAVGGYVSWGGGSDSYFEYLLKYPRLTNTDDSVFIDTWKTAVDSSIHNLLRKATVGDHLYTCTYDAEIGKFRHISSHLSCFHGGNWLYGGKLLGNSTIIDYALQLIDGCWNTYESTATGIGPEAFAYASSDGNYTGVDPPTDADLEFYAKHGFYSYRPYYILRPEVLESNFYAWRITGNTKYLDRAAKAVESFSKYLPAAVGFAGIEDVRDPASAKIDDMESFWFAEVLKYLYLTFDDPKHIDIDEYIFNTEAHPFKAPRSRASYGSDATIPARPFRTRPGPPLPDVSPNRFVPKNTPGP
ncbi:glycoside hydrolase family 47 protein [Lyophyllum atratum]|nr:glycoside hydrolase family 47 protein [Lyophyllum atratum]